MEWQNRMQRAIDYLEEHLTEEICWQDAAACALCSVGYFQRLFALLCGVTPAEYVRNRRLTLAGSALCGTGEKVIDVALQFGYESPESFTRAFTRFHGITPMAAKRPGAKLRSFSRLFVSTNLHGGTSMDYKIIEKNAFFVLEKAETHSTENETNKTSIPDFWTRSHRDGTVKKLSGLSADPGRIFGICYAGEVGGETFEYAIAAPCGEEDPLPQGFRKRRIPARTWAVFASKGAMPTAIQTLWQRIVSEFFGASGYEPTCEMDIEVYTDGDMSNPAYESEIWVPVRKKALNDMAENA